MITVQRTRRMNVPADRIRALLSNPQQLQGVVPAVRSVDVVSRSGNQARVVITTGLTLRGADRVEGTMTTLPEGVHFAASQPMPAALHLTAVPQGTGSQVTARIESELPPGLGMMARFIPQQVIDNRVGTELERALERLERIAQQ